MKLPLKLKGFNLFFEGLNMHGMLGDITRPKIAIKTEDWRAGGMLGDVKIEQGLEALEIEITVGGYAAELLREMGGTISGKTLRYQGALQQDDSAEYAELVGEARGRLIEADPGSDKAGEGGEHKFKMALTYWRETLNGKALAEIDMLGNKMAINGHDQKAGLRRALGL